MRRTLACVIAGVALVGSTSAGATEADHQISRDQL
jgi:hypothetical protein